MAPFQLTNPPPPKKIPHTRISGKSDAGVILESPRPTCRSLHVRGPQAPMPRIATSLGNISGQPSDQNAVDCSVLTSYCRMTTQGHILPVWRLRRSGTSISSASLIRRTRLTSPLMTTISLGHSRRLLVERLTGPMKGAGGGAWVATNATKGLFFTRNSGISDALEDMHWTQRDLCWKITTLYRNYLHQISWKQIFVKVFIWLTNVVSCTRPTPHSPATPTFW
jgi:hypothetical protein